ncbi:MAG: hypothetical protein KME54_12390 [Tolypothrix brevis GSE-NOS-MK-07-07A]|nr:hypothetical protein [Tolypothrix brevis GSE-NOS-MK-07-07A]
MSQNRLISVCDRALRGSPWEHRVAFRNENRPYENMNITDIKGLTDAEISTLKA